MRSASRNFAVLHFSEDGSPHDTREKTGPSEEVSDKSDEVKHIKEATVSPTRNEQNKHVDANDNKIESEVHQNTYEKHKLEEAERLLRIVKKKFLVLNQQHENVVSEYVLFYHLPLKYQQCGNI